MVSQQYQWWSYDVNVGHGHRDSEWTRIQTTAAKKTLMLGQIKMATHNLYALVYKHLHKKIPPQEAGMTLQQLDKVSTG